jgi:ribosomal protein RSM22 (predicted rRNA methylase)
MKVNHRLIWLQVLQDFLESTCSESNEDLTSKVANIEKQNANYSCSSFHSQSLSERSNILMSLCSEKDVVATQTLDYSGSKLHYQETSKSKWPNCWSLVRKQIY